MNYKILSKNALAAFLSQGVSMGISILMSLIVPKVLGVQEYGYWQLFIFYASYSGLFLFGLNDGIYLISGGKSRSEIDKQSIGSQFRVGAAFQLLIAAIVAIGGLCLTSEWERSYVLVTLGLYISINNLTGYIGYVFQAMNETRRFSFSIVLDRLTFLVPLLFMVILRVSDFRPYVIAYLASKTISLAWCCWEARDILSAPPLSASEAVRESIASIRVGFKLMIANVADMLILGVARALVDAVWGIEAFGRVSFSLSLVNFFITFVTQASMVLFPALRQSDEGERRAVYRGMRDAMEAAFPAVYALYFPMAWLLSVWLPQYAESMRWLAVLLPVCVFNTKMDVCCTTYFKVLRQERTLLAINIVTVAASAVTSLVGVFALGSLEAVLVGAVCCIAARSAWSELRLDRELDVARSPMLVPELLLTAAFVLLALLLPGMWALPAYCILYGAYLFANRGEVASIVARVKKVAR